MANPHIISGQRTSTPGRRTSTPGRRSSTRRRRRKPTQRGGRRGRIGAIQSEGVGGPTVGNGDTGGGDTGGGYPGGGTTQTETVTKKPRGIPVGAAIIVILGVVVLSKGR